MKVVTEQTKLSKLVKNTVINLCHNELTFKTMDISGVIGITLDDDKTFLVEIKKKLKKVGCQGESDSEGPGPRDSGYSSVTNHVAQNGLNEQQYETRFYTEQEKKQENRSCITGQQKLSWQAYVAKQEKEKARCQKPQYLYVKDDRPKNDACLSKQENPTHDSRKPEDRNQQQDPQIVPETKQHPKQACGWKVSVGPDEEEYETNTQISQAEKKPNETQPLTLVFRREAPTNRLESEANPQNQGTQIYLRKRRCQDKETSRGWINGHSVSSGPQLQPKEDSVAAPCDTSMPRKNSVERTRCSSEFISRQKELVQMPPNKPSMKPSAVVVQRSSVHFDYGESLIPKPILNDAPCSLCHKSMERNVEQATEKHEMLTTEKPHLTSEDFGVSPTDKDSGKGPSVSTDEEDDTAVIPEGPNIIILKKGRPVDILKKSNGATKAEDELESVAMKENRVAVKALALKRSQEEKQSPQADLCPNPAETQMSAWKDNHDKESSACPELTDSTDSDEGVDFDMEEKPVTVQESGIKTDSDGWDKTVRERKVLADITSKQKPVVDTLKQRQRSGNQKAEEHDEICPFIDQENTSSISVAVNNAICQASMRKDALKFSKDNTGGNRTDMTCVNHDCNAESHPTAESTDDNVNEEENGTSVAGNGMAEEASNLNQNNSNNSTEDCTENRVRSMRRQIKEKFGFPVLYGNCEMMGEFDSSCDDYDKHASCKNKWLNDDLSGSGTYEYSGESDTTDEESMTSDTERGTEECRESEQYLLCGSVEDKENARLQASTALLKSDKTCPTSLASEKVQNDKSESSKVQSSSSQSADKDAGFMCYFCPEHHAISSMQDFLQHQIEAVTKKYYEGFDTGADKATDTTRGNVTNNSKPDSSMSKSNQETCSSSQSDVPTKQSDKGMSDKGMAKQMEMPSQDADSLQDDADDTTSSVGFSETDAYLTSIEQAAGLRSDTTKSEGLLPDYENSKKGWRLEACSCVHNCAATSQSTVNEGTCVPNNDDVSQMLCHTTDRMRLRECSSVRSVQPVGFNTNGAKPRNGDNTEQTSAVRSSGKDIPSQNDVIANALTLDSTKGSNQAEKTTSSSSSRIHNASHTKESTADHQTKDQACGFKVVESLDRDYQKFEKSIGNEKSDSHAPTSVPSKEKPERTEKNTVFLTEIAEDEYADSQRREKVSSEKSRPGNVKWRTRKEIPNYFDIGRRLDKDFQKLEEVISVALEKEAPDQNGRADGKVQMKSDNDRKKLDSQNPENGERRDLVTQPKSSINKKLVAFEPTRQEIDELMGQSKPSKPQRHSSSIPGYVCYVCGEVLWDKIVLHQHLNIEHVVGAEAHESAQVPSPCKMLRLPSTFPYDPQQYLHDLYIDEPKSDSKQTCNYCYRKFDEVFEFTSHIVNNHISAFVQYPGEFKLCYCVYCPKVFSSLEAITMHDCKGIFDVKTSKTSQKLETIRRAEYEAKKPKATTDSSSTMRSCNGEFDAYATIRNAEYEAKKPKTENGGRKVIPLVQDEKTHRYMKCGMDRPSIGTRTISSSLKHQALLLACKLCCKKFEDVNALFEHTKFHCRAKMHRPTSSIRGANTTMIDQRLPMAAN